MCGRYILVQKVEVLEKRFNSPFEDADSYKPSFNISPGTYAAVVTPDNGGSIRHMRFGLTPFWSKKKAFFINARSEGDRNLQNDPAYSGAKDIINKPAFRKPIRSSRCLIPADAFIEGTIKEKLKKPYLVYLRNKIRPFAFAGIYDVWKNPESGEEVSSFAIITTTANRILQKIPHHRSPVILAPSMERKWLSPKTALMDITAMLQPFPADLMNAYPIDPQISNVKNNAREFILPIGEALEAEEEFAVYRNLKLQGMGNPKKK